MSKFEAETIRRADLLQQRLHSKFVILVLEESKYVMRISDKGTLKMSRRRRNAKIFDTSEQAFQELEKLSEISQSTHTFYLLYA